MAFVMRLSKRVSQIPASLTLSITSKAKEMRSRGVDVVNFGAGEPDLDTPDHIKEAAIASIREGFTKYTAESGTPELRKAVAEKLKKENGLSYESSQVVVSCGAKHSLYNVIISLCDVGDEVIIPAPYWLSYPEMVRLAGATPVFVATDPATYKLRPEELARHITKKTKALILNSPSNPTGAVYGKEELTWIRDLALKHNIFIISDEIYEKLVYDGNRHISIASLDNGIERMTCVVNGVSKAYSMTGWRIGYAAGPQDLMKAISNVQSHSTSNPTSISQRAALAALTDPKSESFVNGMRAEYEARRDYAVSRIQRMEKITCVKPAGAFYILCNIASCAMSSIPFAQRLLEEAHVAVVPGAPFGADNCIRVSFATSKAQIEKGLDRLEKWVKG